MKPSLHELISKEIYDNVFVCLTADTSRDKEGCELLAERIIKIVRDYHLVEPKTNEEIPPDFTDETVKKWKQERGE